MQVGSVTVVIFCLLAFVEFACRLKAMEFFFMCPTAATPELGTIRKK
jgi:hypothetical protein